MNARSLILQLSDKLQHGESAYALVGMKAVAFSVQVDENDLVHDLKIVEAERSVVREIELYLARKDNAWLRSGDEAVVQLRNGHVDASIEAKIIAEQMDATWTIKDSLGEDDLKSLAPGKIHILVKLPPPRTAGQAVSDLFR
ncbi:hypothetical protein FI667_g3410, partial [Globisporangium splendens]